MLDNLVLLLNTRATRPHGQFHILLKALKQLVQLIGRFDQVSLGEAVTSGIVALLGGFQFLEHEDQQLVAHLERGLELAHELREVGAD